jgi:hypothetical protein
MTDPQKAVKYFNLRGISAHENDENGVNIITPDSNEFIIEISESEIKYRAELYDEQEKSEE